MKREVEKRTKVSPYLLFVSMALLFASSEVRGCSARRALEQSRAQFGEAIKIGNEAIEEGERWKEQAERCDRPLTFSNATFGDATNNLYGIGVQDNVLHVYELTDAGFVVGGTYPPPTATLPNDVNGVLSFRYRWASPPSCVLTTTETELRYVCLDGGGAR